MLIGRLWVHRLEQWDLDCWPIVCVHWKTPNQSRRIFCLWSRGIQIGGGKRWVFRLTRKAITLGQHIYKFKGA